jgi:hypothetical protein
VPDNQLLQEADFDRVNSRLNESLKTCRSMVADYRAFLANDDGSGTADEEKQSEPALKLALAEGK